jgi:hydroxyacyl-ACP dehydratase HTD2-like protein with hotdog domain
MTAGAGVRVGEPIGSVEYTPTRVTLFLFGVAHWTPHRIHYDVEWARAEGFPDVLVTAQLMSAWQIGLVTRWAGDARYLRRFTERNLGPAYAGDTLTVRGEVAAVKSIEQGLEVECSLSVRKESDPVATSTALLVLPPDHTTETPSSRL